MLSGWPGCTDSSKNAKPNGLPDGANCHWDATTKSFDNVQPRKGSHYINSTKDELHQNWILDTSRVENGRAILLKVR